MSYLASLDVTEEAHILAVANSLRTYGIQLTSSVIVKYNPLHPSSIYINTELLTQINSQLEGSNTLRLSEASKALANFYLQLSMCATNKIINNFSFN